MWAERVMGIEPTLSAWKAEVLPLNYTRFQKTEDGESSLNPCFLLSVWYGGGRIRTYEGIAVRFTV